MIEMALERLLWASENSLAISAVISVVVIAVYLIRGVARRSWRKS